MPSVRQNVDNVPVGAVGQPETLSGQEDHHQWTAQGSPLVSGSVEAQGVDRKWQWTMVQWKQHQWSSGLSAKEESWGWVHVYTLLYRDFGSTLSWSAPTSASIRSAPTSPSPLLPPPLPTLALVPSSVELFIYFSNVIIFVECYIHVYYTPSSLDPSEPDSSEPDSSVLLSSDSCGRGKSGSYLHHLNLRSSSSSTMPKASSTVNLAMIALCKASKNIQLLSKSVIIKKRLKLQGSSPTHAQGEMSLPGHVCGLPCALRGKLHYNLGMYVAFRVQWVKKLFLAKKVPNLIVHLSSHTSGIRASSSVFLRC